MSVPDGSLAGISERFRALARERRVEGVDAAVLPQHVVALAREVLGSDAAGLSVLSRDFRVPLGASDADAAGAERLQFTAGQGPCWDAIRADVPLVASRAQIERRWPEFADEFTTRTPFRSVASVPVRLARGAGGAVDLYYRDPEGAAAFDPDDGSVVAAHIADLLNRAAASDHEPTRVGLVGPAWARGPAARGRLAVWVAVGLVMNQLDQLPDAALDLLRAAAYSAGRSLDEVAADLVDGRLDVRALAP